MAVVIVTYRCAQLTINAVRSIATERAATGLPIRVVVVDNNSGDLPDIAEVMEHRGWSSWLTLVLSPTNGGFAFGNNLGIQRAYADSVPDYIYLLNPDAEVRPGGIASLVQFLTERPEAGIAGSSFENLDGSDWPIAFRFPTLLSEIDAGLQLGVASRLLAPWITARVMDKTSQPVDWISGASMMIRPEVFAAIGGLDENYFLYFEETDFCWRAHQAGFQTWYVPDSRIMHVQGQSTEVTGVQARHSRVPAYWFESRRRYFIVTFGVWRAILIDIVAAAAQIGGFLKRLLLGRSGTATPHFIRDLIRHSALWPKNRQHRPFRSCI